MGDDKRQIVENLRSAENGDAVEHPRHYTQGKIECIDAMRSMEGDGFAAHLRCTTLKYLWRYDRKNGLEDLLKARWYLDRLIEEARAGEGRAVLAETGDDALSDAVLAANDAKRAMVERTCNEEASRARIGYGIGAGENEDRDESEYGECGKKGCMKTLHGPVTGFCV